MRRLKSNILTKRAVWAHWLIMGATTLGFLLFRVPLAAAASWASLQLWGLIDAGKELVFSSLSTGLLPTGAGVMTKEIAYGAYLV